jgi:hypothetical protein
MKINKSRLLQIIREEVELHEKNTLELDESELGAFADADSNKDGELSKKEKNKAINVAIAADEEAGNLEEKEGPQEDQLFALDKPHKLIEPDKKSKLEIRIR